MASDFWSRQKEKLQKEGVIPTSKPVSQSQPWWADGTDLLRQRETQPQQPVQSQPEPSKGPTCPVCHSDSYVKPTSSTAARCFDCGHVDGRQLNEPNLPTGMLGDNVQTLKVKQLSSQGHFGRTTAEINANNAILEQSASGKIKLT